MAQDTPNAAPNMVSSTPGTAQSGVYGAQPARVNTYPAQPPVSEKPKKKKTGLIIGIITAVVVFFIVMVIVGAGSGDDYSDDYVGDYDYADDYDYSFDDEFDIDSDYGSSVDFTTGEITDDIYVNEWADIRFALSDGWVNGEAQDYEDINNSIVTCGLYAENSANTLTINYVDTGEENMSAKSLESYLDDYVSGMTTPLDSHEISESEYKMVGGYSYLCADLKGEASGYTIYFTTCMREQDGYLIMITVVGASKAENYSILEKISSSVNY